MVVEEGERERGREGGKRERSALVPLSSSSSFYSSSFFNYWFLPLPSSLSIMFSLIIILVILQVLILRGCYQPVS